MPSTPIPTAGLTTLLTAALGVGTAGAATLLVPEDFPSIRAALTASAPGDEIVLADGVYAGPVNRNLEFDGKSVTVRSASGDPSVCTVDIEFGGRFGVFSNGDASTIQGLTIQNGFLGPGADGGGVLIEAGAAPMFIDCVVRDCFAGGQGGGFRVLPGGGVAIDGCEVSGNTASGGGGGGLMSSDGVLTIVASEFSDNTADGAGGGAHADQGSDVAIEGSHFAGNVAGAAGGGMRIGGAEAVAVVDSTFIGNIAGNCCGGVIVSGAVQGGSISGCVFQGNLADASGQGFGAGGLDVENNGPFSVSDCVFDGNTAPVAAGMLVRNTSADLEDLLFTNNIAEIAAGGLAIDGVGQAVNVRGARMLGNTANFGAGAGVAVLEGVTFTNCLIAFNTASVEGLENPAGGGIDVILGGQVSVANSTIAYNTSGAYGGGVNVSGGGSVELVNTVVWANAAPDGPNLHVGYPTAESGELAVSFSCIEGGDKGVGVLGGVLSYGPGNIETDPMFFDLDGPDDDALSLEDNDLSLGAGSPCIDAADNTVVPEGVALDLDGAARFVDDPSTPDTGVPGGDGGDAIVDMGAYEFQPSGGACCFGAVCFVQPPDACAAEGGSYQGDGTTCDSGSCDPDPLAGACCLPGGLLCTVTSLDVCTELGGGFQGVGSPCAGGCSCPADLDGSGSIDSPDLNILLGGFGCTAGDCPGDVDGDGDTDSADLNQLLGAFGGDCP